MGKGAVFLSREESWLRQEGLRHKGFDAITASFALMAFSAVKKVEAKKRKKMRHISVSLFSFKIIKNDS